jgi:hypothetical protein
MIEGELQEEKENAMSSQNGQENGRGLGLSHIGRQEGCRHVANHQGTRHQGGHHEGNPRNQAKGDDTDDDGRHEGNQGISIQTDPVDQQQGLHVQTLCSNPQDGRKDKGVGQKDRGRMQQMVNVVIKLLNVASMKIVMHIGSHLWNGKLRMMSVRWRGPCTWACLRQLLLFTYPNEKDQGRGNPKGSIQIRSLQRIRLSNAQDIVAEMLGLVKIQHDRFDSGDNVVGINVKVSSVRVQGQAHHAISPPRCTRNHLGCRLLLSRSHGGHGAGGRKKPVGLLGNKHVWLSLRLILERLLRRRLLELRLLLVVLKKRIRLGAGIKKEIVAGTGGTEWIVFKRIIVGGGVHHGCDRGGCDFNSFLLRVESGFD